MLRYMLCSCFEFNLKMDKIANRLVEVEIHWIVAITQKCYRLQPILSQNEIWTPKKKPDQICCNGEFVRFLSVCSQFSQSVFRKSDGNGMYFEKRCSYVCILVHLWLSVSTDAYNVLEATRIARIIIEFPWTWTTDSAIITNALKWT